MMVTKDDAVQAIHDLNDIISRLRHREGYNGRCGYTELSDSELSANEIHAHAHIALIAEFLEHGDV